MTPPFKVIFIRLHTILLIVWGKLWVLIGAHCIGHLIGKLTKRGVETAKVGKYGDGRASFDPGMSLEEMEQWFNEELKTGK